MLQAFQRDRFGVLALCIGLCLLIFGAAMNSQALVSAGAVMSTIGIVKLALPAVRRRFDPYDLKKLQDLEFRMTEDRVGEPDGDPVCPRCGDVYTRDLFDCPRCRRI